MPIAKIKATSNLDAMKSEEGNDSLDTIIRQAVGKEPFLSFPRAGESPVQLIKLLHALDEQEPLGWPLLSPLKVQMQKCDKCSREFCSPINYRRHIRVHHRLKKLDKDSMKNRDLLGAFWDTLTIEDTKEVVSFKNLSLEEVSGSSIIKALTTLIRKPGFSSLPHMYLKAGSVLLDIIQARPSRFPMSSQELFSILDDASERTFLSGSALSLPRYIFDGEAGKICLESKNLVACTSFLLEKILIKAWLAEKDAEAMRFQKLLVEEEEAAQRRQVELLERKRQKKLRQKEQKAREWQGQEEANVDEILETVPPIETCTSSVTFDLQTPSEMPHHNTFSNIDHSNTDEIVNTESHSGVRSDHSNLGTGLDAERHSVQGSGRKHLVAGWWRVQTKLQHAMSNSFHAVQSSRPSKVGGTQNCGSRIDLRTATTTGNKIWSRKYKPESGGESLKARVEKEDPNESEQIKKSEVVIGSITVSLSNNNQEGNNISGSCQDCLIDHQRPNNNAEDKAKTSDSVQVCTNRSTVKFWRPIKHNGVKGPMPVPNNNRVSRSEGIEEDHGESLDGESCPMLHDMNSYDDGIANCFMDPNGNGRFSSHSAKAFLAQRWKEAFATEYVKLVLSPESEHVDSLKVQNGSKETKSHSSKLHNRTILKNAEYQVVNVKSLELPIAEAVRVKSRNMPEKGFKYIPKPRTPT